MGRAAPSSVGWERQEICSVLISRYAEDYRSSFRKSDELRVHCKLSGVRDDEALYRKPSHGTNYSDRNLPTQCLSLRVGIGSRVHSTDMPSSPRRHLGLAEVGNLGIMFEDLCD